MRIDDYKNACRLSAAELAKKDPLATAAASGTNWDGSSFILPFFGRQVKVTAPDMTVTWADQAPDEDFSLTDAVLVLHYLENADGTPPAGEMVAFRQLDSGQFYWDAFHRRAEVPLAKTFGQKPGLLLKTIEAMGGKIVPGRGDESGTFRVLPHLELSVMLHLADEEFESDGQVLFDGVIRSYLPIEDVSWLGSGLVYRLMGLSKTLKA